MTSRFERANGFPAASFREAIQRDGVLGTILGDSNQYGPLSMLFVLLTVATVTGALIKLVSNMI
jgi:hypothetical protein